MCGACIFLFNADCKRTGSHKALRFFTEIYVAWLARLAEANKTMNKISGVKVIGPSTVTNVLHHKLITPWTCDHVWNYVVSIYRLAINIDVAHTVRQFENIFANWFLKAIDILLSAIGLTRNYPGRLWAQTLFHNIYNFTNHIYEHVLGCFWVGAIECVRWTCRDFFGQ